MTELSFLIELLLKHKLPAATKDAIAARIKDVESSVVSYSNFGNRPISNPASVAGASIGGSNQSPSTIALLAKHPDLVAQMNHEPKPVEVIAQTPAAMASVDTRAQAMAGDKNARQLYKARPK